MKRTFFVGILVVALWLSAVGIRTANAGEKLPSPANILMAQNSAPEPTRETFTNDLSPTHAATIVTQGPIGQYSTYQEGEYLFVEIPERAKPRLQIEQAERGFDNVRVQSRGDLIVMSFPLKPGTVAQVGHRGNRLEVLLRAATSASADTAISPAQPPADTAPALAQPRIDTVPIPPPSPPISSSIPDSAIPVRRILEPDLSVPESPAFTVLGVTPQTVIRPSSPRALGMGLLNGVDREGNFQTGIAIDTTPYLLLAGNEFTLDKYKDQYHLKLLARTQLSFATTKGADDDDKSARLAFGLHVTPWDRGDPRYDEKLVDCFRTFSFDLPGSTTEQEAFLKKKWTKCHEDAQQRNWNRSSWVLGGAPSWRSLNGNVSKLRWDGGGVWSSVAYGFEEVPLLKDTSQLIFHARYRDAEYIPDPADKDKFLRHDSLYLGARLRVGVPKLIANVEGVFIQDDPEGRRSDDLYRLSFGGELRLTDDLWLSVTVGGEGGRRNGKNQAFALTTFKYALPHGFR